MFNYCQSHVLKFKSTRNSIQTELSRYHNNIFTIITSYNVLIAAYSFDILHNNLISSYNLVIFHTKSNFFSLIKQITKNNVST